MAETKIKAVLFDLGETLLNFGKIDPVGLFRQGGHSAYDFLKKLNQPVGKLNSFIRKHLLMIRLYHIWSNIVGKDFDSLELLKKIEQKKGVRLQLQQWQDFAWCWYEPLSKCAVIENDIKITLDKLRTAGLKLGILSNTFIPATSLERHLEQLGILEFFSTRLYSYQFSYRKPDKRIFIEAAKKMDSRPENIMFTGDRIDTDILGALKVNMFAAIKKAYTNNGKRIPENVIKVDKLAELPEIIEKINHGTFRQNNGKF